jgi:NodT family efflux transporter outer membrane factor (OMF) lipoprotein
MVGPNYHRPPAAVPDFFKEQPPAGSTLAAEWRTAQPSDEAIRQKWWEAFQDPQLNALEEQVAGANQNVAQAEAQFRAARAAIRGVRADLFPTVTAGASANASHVSPHVSPTQRGIATGSSIEYQLPIDFSYEIDAWGRVRRSVEASVATAQASAADVQTILLSATSELAVDYFSLRGLDAQIQLMTTTADAYRRALQLTQARYQQGVAAGTDVAEAQTQLDTTLAQATDLAIARAQFEHATAMLVGKPPAGFTIGADARPVVPPIVPIAIPSTVVQRRPDVASAERRMAAANAQIGVAQAAFFPALSLTASGGFESTVLSTLVTWPSRFWSLGPAITETIFDAGRRRAAVEQARATYEGTIAAYRQSVLTAFQDVEDNLAALRVLADESAQAQAAVNSAERSLNLATLRYSGGITTYLEVITAQTAALTNERTLVDVGTRRLTASVLLIKALGGGWSDAQLPAVTSR